MNATQLPAVGVAELLSALPALLDPIAARAQTDPETVHQTDPETVHRVLVAALELTEAVAP